MNALLVTLAASVLGTAFAAEPKPAASSPAPAPAPAPGTSPAPAAAPKPADDAPSLDRLLGLPEDKDTSAPGEAARQNQKELERRLNDAALGDVLDRALGGMDDSARLLDGQDPGLGTQRVQRDVLSRLDELIDMAKQMSQKQQQQSGGSSSSSSSRPQRGQPKPGTQPKPAAAGERRDGENRGQENEPPAGREGALNTVLQQTESEWGSLPQRLRDALKQSRNGVRSKLYKELSDEYYTRLAEEGTP